MRILFDFVRCVCFAAILCSFGSFPGGLRAAETAAVTTQDPTIQIDQLRWLLKPLTQEELVVEADGWRDLLKAKATQIGQAEIARTRQNEQIDRAEEAAEALEEAKEAAEEATSGVAPGDGDATERAVEKAKEKAGEAQVAIDAARAATEEAEQDSSSQAAKALVEEVQSAEESEVKTELSTETVEEVAATTLSTNEMESAERLGAVAEAAKQAAAEEVEAKQAILDVLAKLREERTSLVDRLTVVLDELKAKGGDATAYEQYIASVQQYMVDVSDTSAMATFATSWLTSEQGGIRVGVNFGKFVLLILVFYGLAIILSKATEKATTRSRRMSELLRQFMVTSVKRGTILVGLIIGLSAMGFPVGPVLAVITAAGFIIGLALQGTLSNFASGLLILFYRPFDVGDAVEGGGVAGTVTAMNLMSTQIRTWDNKAMIVPNNQIWGGVITNITGTDRRRVDMVFGIGYGDSMDKAQEILERILSGHEKVLKDPAPVVKVHELGDSSVNFVVRPWVRPADYWAVYWDVTRKVKEDFDREGVSIPFPQRDVHLYETKE